MINSDLLQIVRQKSNLMTAGETLNILMIVGKS